MIAICRSFTSYLVSDLVSLETQATQPLYCKQNLQKDDF